MDDDAEFRDIIVQNLEQKGVLQKMRVSFEFPNIFNFVYF